MSVIEAIILGLVQGLTEFIPVSSSGHLLLLHHAFGIENQGLGFDVALHIGTLMALVIFFYKDIFDLIGDALRGGPKRRLAVILAVATVPAAIMGVLLQETAETSFRSPLLVAVMLSVVAIFMLLAERYAAERPSQPSLEKTSFKQGLAAGLAQAVALIPGVSRSGGTITAGLFAGLSRVAATRFSFLLSIPITFGAVIKVSLDQETIRQVSGQPGVFFIGVIAALISGIVAIRFLLRFVAKHSLKSFAYYRLGLAGLTILLLAAL